MLKKGFSQISRLGKRSFVATRHFAASFKLAQLRPYALPAAIVMTLLVSATFLPMPKGIQSSSQSSQTNDSRQPDKEASKPKEKRQSNSKRPDPKSSSGSDRPSQKLSYQDQVKEFVNTKRITEAQSKLLLDKWSELSKTTTVNEGKLALSREQRRELRAWAESNKIPYRYVNRIY